VCHWSVAGGRRKYILPASVSGQDVRSDAAA
jgi:hypothetical protein